MFELHHPVYHHSHNSLTPFRKWCYDFLTFRFGIRKYAPKRPEALEPPFSSSLGVFGDGFRWVDVGWMLAINQKHKGPKKTKKDPLVVRIPSLKLTAKAPENGWLEDEFPFGMAQFQGLCVSFRKSKWRWDLLNHHRPVVGKLLSFWGPVYFQGGVR